MKRAHNIFKSHKLIRVAMEYDEVGNTINSIRIAGDFFLYPEEALEALEEVLIGTKLQKDSLCREIDKGLENIEAYGIDSLSLTEAILGCKPE